MPQNSLSNAPIRFVVAIYNRRPFITKEAFGGISGRYPQYYMAYDDLRVSSRVLTKI